jgi:hypothetical protein
MKPGHERQPVSSLRQQSGRNRQYGQPIHIQSSRPYVLVIFAALPSRNLYLDDMDGMANWSSLTRLIGSWKGTGRGEFPTIEPFSFREAFEVIEAVPGESLHYRQRTWRTDANPEAMSHVETGFINVVSGGNVEVLNAQGRNRVEVLTGIMQRTRLGFTMSLRSRSIVHDERMVTSWREWQLATDGFAYSMGMSTTEVPDGAHHLSGQLQRQRH